jgi:hypothetical protein
MDKTWCKGCPKNLFDVNFVKFRSVETYVCKLILISSLRAYCRELCEILHARNAARRL